MTVKAQLELFTIDNSNGSDALVRLTTLTLNPGDVIVMRGDTIHAGAAYRRGHFGRVHCYLDNPAVQRMPNHTDRKGLPELATNVVSTAAQSKRKKKKN